MSATEQLISPKGGLFLVEILAGIVVIGFTIKSFIDAPSLSDIKDSVTDTLTTATQAATTSVYEGWDLLNFSTGTNERINASWPNYHLKYPEISQDQLWELYKATFPAKAVGDQIADFTTLLENQQSPNSLSQTAQVIGSQYDRLAAAWPGWLAAWPNWAINHDDGSTNKKGILWRDYHKNLQSKSMNDFLTFLENKMNPNYIYKKNLAEWVYPPDPAAMIPSTQRTSGQSTSRARLLTNPNAFPTNDNVVAANSFTFPVDSTYIPNIQKDQIYGVQPVRQPDILSATPQNSRSITAVTPYVPNQVAGIQNITSFNYSNQIPQSTTFKPTAASDVTLTPGGVRNYVGVDIPQSAFRR